MWNLEGNEEWSNVQSAVGSAEKNVFFCRVLPCWTTYGWPVPNGALDDLARATMTIMETPIIDQNQAPDSASWDPATLSTMAEFNH